MLHTAVLKLVVSRIVVMEEGRRFQSRLVLRMKESWWKLVWENGTPPFRLWSERDNNKKFWGFMFQNLNLIMRHTVLIFTTWGSLMCL